MKQLERNYGTLNAFYYHDFHSVLTKEQKKVVDLRLFKKIIVKYVEVYVRDLYQNFTMPAYFPFSGAIKLTRERFRGKIIIKWLWLFQPSVQTIRYVNLIKQRRGEKIVSLTEKRFKEKNDILELPINSVEFQQRLKLNQIIAK